MTAVRYPKPLFAWSYSGLSMYENCPRKYWAVKIKKVDDGNAYNRQGDGEHVSIERFFKMNMPLAEVLLPLQPLFERIRAAPGETYTEQQLCIDERFVPCKYKDWDNAWLRGAGDLVKVNGSVATYFDWKSGKVRKEIEDQVDLTGLLLLRHYPAVQTIKAGVLYYRHGVMVPHIVQRADEQRLWNSFFARLAPLKESYETDSWPATPNPLCGWCPYRACPHNTTAEREARDAAKAAK